MASFKGHIAAGVCVGVACSAASSEYLGVHDFEMLSILFGASVIGSVLPDIDSDSGTPFQILFGIFSVLAAGIALYWTLAISMSSGWDVVKAPAIAFLVTRFIVGEIFKRFTDHRGIFHSFPAMGIAFFATFLLSRYLGSGAMHALLVAFAVAAGFLSHLILDESFAATNFSGKRFHMNHMFGTALKFWSNSKIATLLAYGAVFILGYASLLKL